MSGKGQKYLILLNLIVIELLYLSNISIGQYVKKWKILICVIHWGTRNGPHFHTESHTACELNYKDFLNFCSQVPGESRDNKKMQI